MPLRRFQQTARHRTPIPQEEQLLEPLADAYLKEREALAERVREEAERRFPSAGIRERLLARRK